MKYLFFSVAMMASTAFAADPGPNDCITIDTKDGFTLLTNKCLETVNVFWLYEGDCTTGCTTKLAGKAYKYEVLFKEPYHMAACFSPEQVDPNWKGFGVATCKPPTTP